VIDDPFQLVEAEQLVRDWYSRDGVEASHEQTIELWARLLTLDVVSADKRFEELCQDTRLFLVASFQMGRAARE
jgi:hypothetical protein